MKFHVGNGASDSTRLSPHCPLSLLLSHCLGHADPASCSLQRTLHLVNVPTKRRESPLHTPGRAPAAPTLAPGTPLLWAQPALPGALAGDKPCR